MGGKQAAQVLATVKQDQALREGSDLSDDEIDAIQDPIMKQYEREGSPYYSTARLWDDGILNPIHTRSALSLALAAAYRVPISDSSFGVFRM